SWGAAPLLAVWLAACGSAGQAASPSASSSGATSATPASASSGKRVISDTLDRQVTVPAQVNRVAAIGTIPGMLSYSITVGEQRKIVTRGGQGGSAGVDANGKQGFNSLALYQAIAPNILTAPSVENAINAPVDAETLLTVHPDVVVAPNLDIAKPA